MFVIIYILLSYSVKSFTCSNSVCLSSYLGDKECDIECMSRDCNFDSPVFDLSPEMVIQKSDCLRNCLYSCALELLLNDRCDAECDIPACGYDLEMCEFCSEGCHDYMLGNGKCDQVCYSEECQYDKGDCALCAEGCKPEMLGDWNCDQECYNKQCDWDSNDCYELMCTPGCNTWLLNDYTCNQECNMPECNYGNTKCFCDRSKCTFEIRESSSCQAQCNVKDCDWHDGKCGDCNAGCFYGMIGDGNCDIACNVEDCRYDLTDCQVDSSPNLKMMYVTNIITQTKGSGTREDPYTSLYYAFTQVSFKNTTIYLLEGDHYLVITSTDNTLITDIYDPLARSDSTKYENIKIITAFCSDDPTLSGCAKERATVYVENKIKITANASRFTIANVNFSGSNLVCNLDYCRDCSIETCRYCPYVNIVKDLYISDALQLISPQQYSQYGKNCSSIFNGFIFIKATSITALTLLNVKFSDFNTWQDSLISVYNSELAMFFVDFEKITPGNKEKDAVVSMIFPRYGSKYRLFRYLGGSVKYLNDGYEINPIVYQGGFLYIEGFSLKVQLKGINFSFNIVQNIKSTTIPKSFMYLKCDSCDFYFQDLSFQNNYSSLGLINVKAGNIYFANISKIQITNTSFYKNTSRYGIIIYKTSYYYTKLTLKSVIFDKCISTESPMITFITEGASMSDKTKPDYYTDGIGKMLFFIQNLSIYNCYSHENLFKANDFFNVMIYDLDISYSGDSDNTLDLVNEYTLNDFKNVDGLKLKFGNRTPYDMKCDKLMYFNNIYQLSYFNSSYTANQCKVDSSIFVENTYPVYIQGLLFEDITMTNEISGLLKISGALGSGIIIKDCIFRNLDMKSGVAAIRISESEKAYLSNLTFYNLKSEQISPLFILRVPKVKIEKCSFDEGKSESQYGYSAAITIDNSDEIDIDSCSFLNLQSDTGPSAIYIQDSKILRITNSTFNKTLSRLYGAVYATSISDFSIDSCTFTQVESQQGIGAGISAVYKPDEVTYKRLSVHNSSFNECNSLKGQGCIIMLEGDQSVYLDIYLTSLKFSDCRSQSGSAIFFHSSVYILNNLIQDIEVKNNYNEITAPIHIQHADGVLNIIDSTFIRNTGAVAGIAALLTYPKQMLKLQNLRIIDNDCITAGIYLQGLDTLSLAISSKLYIMNNRSTGLVVSRLSLIDSDSIYDGNTLGIRIENGANVEIFTTNISKNSNSGKGGGIYLLSFSSLTCTDCRILSNKANSGAGIMVEQEASVIFTRSEFFNNTAEVSGSALYIIGSSSVTSYLEDCDISENISHKEASIHGMVSNIQIRNSRIQKNIAYESTPGIILSYSSIELYNTIMQYHNSSVASFIYAQTTSEIYVENCKFKNGRALLGAGAISILGSQARIIGSIFEDLYSDGDSAGLLVMGGSDVFIESCRFRNITAKSAGSVVHSTFSSLRISNCSLVDFESVGIYGYNLEMLHVVNSSFRQGAGEYGGAISCTDCIQIELLNSQFEDNRAAYSGGALYISSSSENDKCQCIIQSCYFKNNDGNLGGAIYIYGADLDIIDSYFLNNSADNQGGAARMQCTNSQTCNFNIENSTFQGNSAEIAGGGIYWDSSKPIIDSHTSFFNNSAKYGNLIASYTIKMQFYYEDELINYLESESPNPLGYIVSNVAPGQTLTILLSVALIDHYDQIVNSDSSSTAEILVENSLTTSISGTIKTIALKGIFTFDNIKVFAKPGTTVYLQIITSALDSAKKAILDDITQFSSIYLQLNTRFCQIGESEIEKECKICDSGTYSLDPEEPCQECQTEAYCLGNYTMFPRKYYWRSNIYSDTFYECPNKNVCLGSPDFKNYIGECEKGYRGNLCQACENGYSRSSENVCVKCMDELMNQIMIGAVSIGIVIYCTIMVRTTFTSSYAPGSLESIYIKIFTNYLQLVGISVGLDIPWPDSILKFFNFHQNSGNASDQAFSFDCFLESSEDDSYIQVYYKRMFVIAFIPIAALFICIALWTIVSLYKKKRKYLKVEMVATIVILFFFIHPAITENYLSIYSCREIEGEFYLNVNLDIECWKDQHLAYALGVALPCIVIWVIGIPSAILIYLTKQRKNLREIELKLKFGFLYNSYRLSTYYWEFIILYRNLIVIMILVFLSSFSVGIQALAILMVMLVCYYYHIIVNPYRHQHLNELDRKGILAAAITIYCGLYFLTGDIEEQSKVGLFIVILCTNAYFLFIWISNFGHAWFKEMKNKLWILRSIYDRTDGFETENLREPYMMKQVYLQEDQKFITLVNSGEPRPGTSYENIPNDMLNLYKNILNNQEFDIECQNFRNEFNYLKLECPNHSLRYTNSESMYQLENESIRTSRD